MPNKVFIYSGDDVLPDYAANAHHLYHKYGVLTHSRDDLKELFSSGHIFDHVDVTYTTFEGNFDGLKVSVDNPTLVFPGGNAWKIYGTSLSHHPKIAELLSQGWNYVGVCAGAYLAGHEMELYQTPYQFNLNAYAPPTFSCSQQLFGVCHDYNALGPFYPDPTHYLWQICREKLPAEQVANAAITKPYVVSITFADQQRLPALYVNGCAFEKRAAVPDQHTVVASYPDNRYAFFNPHTRSHKTFTTMPAIIHQRVSDDHRRGGMVASGIHFETCVPNSKMLSLFSDPHNAHTIALSSQEIQSLHDSREQAETMYTTLLKETLTPRP